MKNKISLIIIFSLSCFIFIGCATNVSTVKDKGHTVSLSEIELFLADSVFFKSSIVVPLETNSSSLVQKITRMCIVQDTLFILDSALSKVFIFDMKGHYLGGIHEIGNGPQEYIHISDICINPIRKCIALLCDQPYKLMYYTYSGEFIEEASYANYYSELSISGDSIYCYDIGSNGKRKFHIFEYPMIKEGEVSFSTGNYFDAEGEGATYSFSKGKRMTVSDEIMFTWPFDFSIYSLVEGEAYQKYVIDFKEHRMPENLLKDNLSPMDFINLCDEKDYVCTVENVVENSDYLLFGTNKYMFIYDKQMDKLTGYNFIENSALKAGKADYLTLNSSNYIAQVWQSSEFKRHIDNRKERDGNLEGLDRQYLQIYESMEDEDNPILLIYELPCNDAD